MPIVVTTTKNQVDTKGLLSKMVLAPTVITAIYNSDKDVVMSLLNIAVLNAGTTDAYVDIWVANKNVINPSTVDLIENQVKFRKNSVYIRSDLIVDADECVFIRSDSPNVVVRVTGYEDRTP